MKKLLLASALVFVLSKLAPGYFLLSFRHRLIRYTAKQDNTIYGYHLHR